MFRLHSAVDLLTRIDLSNALIFFINSRYQNRTGYLFHVTATPPTRPPARLNAAVFSLLVFIPPVLTLLSARLAPAPNGEFPVMIGFIGGGVAGIACGIMLGFRIGKNPPARLALSVAFAAVMVVVCVSLCCFGCTIGGYQISLH